MFLITLNIFIFGAIIGSFLNVVILRYNNGIFKKSRSECFSCSHPLSFLDLVPILSFFFLEGRCRYCKSAISVQYPLVEFLTALTFASTYLKLGEINFELFFYFIVWSLLIIIFIYDLRHKIIPNEIVYTLITISLLKVAYFFVINKIGLGEIFSFDDFSLNHTILLLSGPITASPFAFLWLISRGKWMGFGDAKLALFLGWFFGFWGAISAVILAFWIGAVVGFLLILFSKIELLSQKFKSFTIKSEIPFAPFLIIGFAIVFFADLNLLNFI